MSINVTNTEGSSSKIIINNLDTKINIYNKGEVSSIIEVNGGGKGEINIQQEEIIWHIVISSLALVALFLYIGYSLYKSKKLKKAEANLVFQEFENQEKYILSLLEKNYKSDIFKNKIKTLLKELRGKFLIEKEEVLLKLEKLKEELHQEIEDDFDEVMKYVNIVNLAKGKIILDEEAIVKIIARLNLCEFYKSIAFFFLKDVSEALKYIKATPTVYKFEQYFNKNNLLNLATKVRKDEVLSNKILKLSEISERSFSSEFQREVIKELEKFFRGA